MFHRSRCLFRVVLVSVVLFAGPASQAGYKQVNASNPNDPMSVRIFELDNGLRVYLTENHEKPRFYAEVTVRAGSMHDPAETTGLAHYLEHLLFKGNRNYGTLEYAKEKKHLDRVRKLYQQHFYEKDAEKRKAIY